MAPDFVDDKASQVYSESGAKVMSNDNRYVFSFVSTFLRQLVSMMPWVSQSKREKDDISQSVSLQEAIAQHVTMEENL